MKFIFIHIPKTGGTTIKTIIKDQYRKNQVYTIRPRRGTTKKTFNNLPIRKKNRVEILQGHMHFGVHQFFENPDDVKYFTMLRKPTDKFISLYYHILRDNKHRLNKELNGNDISFDDFYESKFIERYNNLQTRLIVGKKSSEKVNESDLEVAKDNINKHFIAVGLLEYYQQSIELYKEKLNWEKPINLDRPIKNKGAYKLDETQITSKTRKKIEENNAIDYKLYEFILEKYNFKNK